MQRYEDLCIPKIRPMWDGCHVLVHGYSQVLPRILWATAKENIPEIKAQVEKSLNETDWEHYCGE